MGYHEDFEWDEAKAESNACKHKVTFEDAARVLLDVRGDLFHLDEYDEEHSIREDRPITIAAHPARRSVVLTIVWTDREEDGARVTRIISARPATAGEIRRYEQYLADRQGG